MTTREDTQVQSVKKSHPEFHPHHSHRSSSISHDFTSDYASEVSSTSPKGYETPPSRISTPTPSSPDHNPVMILPPRPEATLLAPRSIYQQPQMFPAFDTISPPTPGVDDTPYIRFAIEQLSFDEDLAGRGRYSTNADAYGIPRIVSAEQQRRSVVQNAPIRFSQQVDRRPQHFRFPSDSSRPQPRTQEVLLPVDPPEGDSYGRLRYVPIALRAPMLAILMLLCLLMMAGITFSNIYASRNNGLYDYDGFTTSRYFVFQYLPTLLGLIILLWLFWLQAAIYRVLPYYSMSNELSNDRVLKHLPVVQSNFMWPDTRFYRAGEPLVGLTLSIFWLMNFTIPLLSSFYQTQYYLDFDSPRWRWSSTQGVGWALVTLYALVLIALVYCALLFRRQRSALTADPSSLADLITLFQRANILLDFDQSEVCDDLEERLPSRLLRLGYWTPSQTPETFYAVGQNNSPLNRLSLQPSTQVTFDQSASQDSFDIERHRYSHDSVFTRNIHSPFVRYRWCPWFLRDGAVLAWGITAILLLIAFLVVSFVKRAVQDGFYPMLSSATRSDGFSPANFLYSFLPAILGQILFLCWQPIDTYYRHIQPYANLADPDGTTAQKSLLQTYPAQPHLLVTLSAIRNRDFKLAYISFIAVMALSIPVLAGGVFTAQLFPNGDIRMVASMPGFIALCVLVSIYALSYLIIWPSRRRYLPHSTDTVAGQLSFLYASPLLHDPNIRSARDKADLVARLSGHVAPVSHAGNRANEKAILTGDGRQKSRIRERYHGQGNTWVDRQLKYAFGIYIGRDGKEHLGIDRLQRPGSGEMLIVTGVRRSIGSRRSR